MKEGEVQGVFTTTASIVHPHLLFSPLPSRSQISAVVFAGPANERKGIKEGRRA